MNQKSTSRKKGIILSLVLIAVLAAAAVIILPKILKKPAGEDALDIKDAASAEVGDVIAMGVYEKDNDPDNGKEPLEWLVLAKEDGKLFLTTYYGIDSLTYNDKYGDITWAESNLRAWMNGTFFEEAFTDQEKAKILVTHVANNDNPRWLTKGGEDTDDRIFLLSADEAVQYFNAAMDEVCPARGLKPTAYAMARGTWKSGYEEFEDNAMSWWLRSPGPSQDAIACVFGNGTILEGDQACFATQGHYCVRPAMWIEIGS